MTNILPASNHWIYDHPIDELVKQFGSPLYLYDLSIVRKQCTQLKQAFGPKTGIYYAVKANPNPEILTIMHQEALVDGLDVASQGEYDIAIASGWQPQQLSYTGPAKKKQELSRIIKQNIGTICVESIQEFNTIKAICHNFPQIQPTLMFRINPKEEMHAYGLKTSGIPSPFGIDEEELPSLFALLQNAQEEYNFLGLHIHVGSQCFSAKAFARHFKNAIAITEQFEKKGFHVKKLNVGGGFGIATWKNGRTLSIQGVAQHFRRLTREYSMQTQIRIEPGRHIMAPSGIYIAQVISQKTSRGQSFQIIDGGMNHLFEAAYAANHYPKKQHQVLNLTRPEAEKEKTNICGSLCTPRDRLAQNFLLPKPQIGDLLGWPNTGAYGLSASPLLFLGHSTPTEILFDGKEYKQIRKKLTLFAFQ